MIAEYKDANDISFLEIKTPLCKATICLHGAQVLSWQPTGHDECFYVSPAAIFEKGTAIRGGIPICWPWFGKKEGKPSHGIARVSDWSIDHTGIDEQTGEASIHLHLFPDDDTLPAAFLRISLSHQLRMRLQTTARNKGGELTTAFHNYFKVGDVRKCKLTGLANTPYEELGKPYKAAAAKATNKPISLSGPTDRIYSGEKPISHLSIEDPLLNRCISIKTEHSHSAVIWNPWEEGAATMNDLPDQDWSQFICAEPALTSKSLLPLSPGQTHIMRQTITIDQI